MNLSDELDNRFCMYASFVQPGDPTRNFEQTSRSPWLYSVNCGYGECKVSCPGVDNGWDRDLIRTRIRFTKPGNEKKYPLINLKMNEKRGNLALDSSYYSNNGRIYNDAFFASNGERNYLQFQSGRMEINHSSSLNIADEMTIEAWIKVPKATDQWQTIIAKQAGCEARNFGLFINRDDGKLHYSMTKDGKCNGSLGNSSVTDGQWHHIALTYQDSTGTAKYYIDGKLDAKQYHGAKLADGINSNPAGVGVNLQGKIDEVKILNYAKTEQEIYQQVVGEPLEDFCSSCETGKPKSSGNADCNNSIDLLDFASWLKVFKLGGTKEEKAAVDFYCQESQGEHLLNQVDLDDWLTNFLASF